MLLTRPRANTAVSSTTYQRNAPIGPAIWQIVISFYLVAIVVCRAVFIQWGIPLPYHEVGYLGTALAIALSANGAFSLVRRRSFRDLCNREHYQRALLWLWLVAFWAVYGYFRHNDMILLVPETISLIYMGLFLLVGIDDQAWNVILKHLTIIFYAGVVMIVLTYDVPLLLEDVRARVQVSDRYLNTVGSQVRPLLAPGLLLGVFGLVRQDEPKWRIFQIGALFIFPAIEAGLFQFRSSAVSFICAIASYFVLRPIFERRAKVGTTVIVFVVLLVIVGIYFETDSARTLEQRATVETERVGLFDYRNGELNALFSDLGLESLVGRGPGGTYDATAVYRFYSNSAQWAWVHFGILIFLLKGGICLLLLFSWFLISGVRFRKLRWYQNPCNLTAALLLPACLFSVSVIPIPLGVDGSLSNIGLVFVLSRFGRNY